MTRVTDLTQEQCFNVLSMLGMTDAAIEMVMRWARLEGIFEGDLNGRYFTVSHDGGNYSIYA